MESFFCEIQNIGLYEFSICEFYHISCLKAYTGRCVIQDRISVA